MENQTITKASNSLIASENEVYTLLSSISSSHSCLLSIPSTESYEEVESSNLMDWLVPYSILPLDSLGVHCGWPIASQPIGETGRPESLYSRSL